MSEDKGRNRKRRGRGEGGVRYDAERKLWVASVSLGYHPDGRRNRPVGYGKTKREALEELDRIRLEAGACNPEAAGLTVSQLLDRWLAANEGRLARRTHENRAEGALLVRAFMGAALVAGVRPLHVENCHRHLAGTCAPSYAWHAARALSAALKHAVRLGVIGSSPADAVGVPPLPKREMLTLTAPQARALVAAAAGYQFHPLLCCALGSGCRQGELLGLAWDDLDLDGASPCLTVRRSLSWTKAHGFQLKPPKTAAARRTVTLPPLAAGALRTHREARRAAGMLGLTTVFATSDGTHASRGKITNHLKRAIARANRAGGPGTPVPAALRFHDLRHTHASLLLSAGQSVRAVAARLGHADPAMTLRIYAHVIPGDDARLAAALEALIGDRSAT